MSVNQSRRRFLQHFSKAVGFLGLSSVGLEMLARTFLEKAWAQTLSQPENPTGYYIHWTFPGGPPRWFFDLLLTPNGKTASNFTPGGFGNILNVSGTNTVVDYTAVKHNIGGTNIYLPPVWSFTPTGQTSFTSILPNTLFVRGMDMEIDNHQLSQQRQVSPVIGGVSIPGVVADGSTRSIPSIADPGTDAARAFKTKKGYVRYEANYTLTSGNNPVKTLLKPFVNFYEGRYQHQADQLPLQEQAFREFEKLVEDQGLDPKALPVMYDNAISLIDAQISNIGNEWDGVFQKYSNLINAAIHPNKGELPGIFDKPVRGSTTDLRFRYSNLAGRFASRTDVRDMITPATTIVLLAENFAIAELTIDRLTSNLILGARTLSRFDTGFEVNASGTHDEHFFGTVFSTIKNTLFYRGFLAGLTEQVKMLKAKNIFDRSVIHISSEFNRIPRSNSSGSDHGFKGSNATIISGMIGGVGCVGNILKAGFPGTEYLGTFGVAAPYVLDGFDRPIQVNDIALTITSMLGVDSVVTNGRSLLAPGAAGKWVIRKKEANNV